MGIPILFHHSIHTSICFSNAIHIQYASNPFSQNKIPLHLDIRIYFHLMTAIPLYQILLLIVTCDPVLRREWGWTELDGIAVSRRSMAMVSPSVTRIDRAVMSKNPLERARSLWDRRRLSNRREQILHFDLSLVGREA